MAHQGDTICRHVGAPDFWPAKAPQSRLKLCVIIKEIITLHSEDQIDIIILTLKKNWKGKKLDETPSYSRYSSGDGKLWTHRPFHRLTYPIKGFYKMF